MQFNVAQQLKEAVGSARKYELNDELHYKTGESSSAVRGPLAFLRTDKGILVQGTLQVSIHCFCVRCLSDFEHQSTMELEEEYVPIEELTTSEMKRELGLENLIIDENHILDLEPAIHDYAILAQPMKPLCRTDCGGICPSCGINLNENRCECSQSPGTLRSLTKAKLELLYHSRTP